MSDATICRLAEERDTPQVRALWQQCFDDSDAFVDWYFRQYYQATNTLGVFQGDALQASAQIIPYTIGVRGTQLDCAYVVGVDTAPTARKKGYARQLLLECLREQRRRKQPISLLMPFEGQFYYRYGWPFCYFHQQFLMAPQELRCAAKEYGQVRSVDLFEAQPELARVYASFTRRYHGTVCRSAQHWRQLLEDAALEHTVCYLLEADHQVEGYCLWTPLKGKIFIREMAWSHVRAKQGLLWYLMQAVPDDHTLWLELPADDTLSGQLAVSKTAAVRYPFLMARIVDVVQCLEAMAYPMAEASLVLQVTDDFADWNTGRFSVNIKQGRATVQRLEEWLESTADVCATIDGLSQLVMGARSAEQLQVQELLQVRDASLLMLLDQLWPPQENYINEYY